MTSSQMMLFGGGVATNIPGFMAWYQASSSIWQSTGLCVDSSGNSYMCGTYFNAFGGIDGFVFKVNSTAVLQWARKFTAPTNTSYIFFRGICVDTSGNIYTVAQNNNGPAISPGYVVKYNTSGTIQWQRQMASATANSNYGFYGVAVDTTGTNLVCHGYSSTNNANALLIITQRLCSTGAVNWQRHYGDTASGTVWFDGRFGSYVDSSGNCYFSYQTTQGPFGTYDQVMVKYNSSGTFQFARILGDSNQQTSAKSVAVDTSGNIYVNTNYGSGGVLVKYDSSGTFAWQIGNSGTGVSVANLCVDSLGNIYTTGTFSAGSQVVSKIDSSGALVWSNTTNMTGISSQSTTTIAIARSGANADDVVYIGSELVTNSTTYQNMICKLPTNGSKTGQNTSFGAFNIQYNSGSGTLVTSTISRSSTAFTSAVSTLTDSAGAATDSAISPTPTAQTFTF